MCGKHYQTVDHPKREPQVGRGLFGIRLLIPHFKFQFSKSIGKCSIFHIFLNLNYPLRKSISFPKCPKITQKFTQNCQTVVMVISIEIQRCLKRDRDIGRKAVLSDVKTAFTCTSALKAMVICFHWARQLFYHEKKKPRNDSIFVGLKWPISMTYSKRPKYHTTGPHIVPAIAHIREYPLLSRHIHFFYIFFYFYLPQNTNNDKTRQLHKSK